MITKNQIGLDPQKTKILAERLNELLANYQVFYMNTRGYHWNIKGDNFFELHLKFEELYNDSLVKIDEIAERVLTLGHTPLHTFSDYIGHAKIDQDRNVTLGKEAIKNILKAYAKLLPLEREILSISEGSADEGTNALMSDYIREQEKSIWMYSSYLG
ncbi:Dps family protein [Aquimarina rhabdastrellae]